VNAYTFSDIGIASDEPRWSFRGVYSNPAQRPGAHLAAYWEAPGFSPANTRNQQIPTVWAAGQRNAEHMLPG
jgi:hypothetical protein